MRSSCPVGPSGFQCWKMWNTGDTASYPHLAVIKKLSFFKNLRSVALESFRLSLHLDTPGYGYCGNQESSKNWKAKPKWTKYRRCLSSQREMCVDFSSGDCITIYLFACPTRCPGIWKSVTPSVKWTRSASSRSFSNQTHEQKKKKNASNPPNHGKTRHKLWRTVSPWWLK